MISTALQFGATNPDRVSFGGALDSNPSAWTFMIWFLTTNFGANGKSLYSALDGSGVGWNVSIRSTGGLALFYGRATVQLEYRSNDAMRLNERTFAALTFNKNGTAGDLAQFYFGTQNLAARSFGLSVTTDGSGTFQLPKDVQLGNRASSSSPHVGLQWAVACVPWILPLPEIHRWQREPHFIQGSLLHCYPGAVKGRLVENLAGTHLGATGTHGVISGAAVPVSAALFPTSERSRRRRYKVPAVATFNPGWAVGASQLLSGGFGA